LKKLNAKQAIAKHKEQNLLQVIDGIV
jgi:hypothetical protein